MTRRMLSPPSPPTPANQSWSQRRRPMRSRTMTFELTKATKEAATTMATATAKPTPTIALAAGEVGVDVTAWRRLWRRLIEEGSRRTWMHSSVLQNYLFYKCTSFRHMSSSGLARHNKSSLDIAGCFRASL